MTPRLYTEHDTVDDLRCACTLARRRGHHRTADFMSAVALALEADAHMPADVYPRARQLARAYIARDFTRKL